MDHPRTTLDEPGRDRRRRGEAGPARPPHRAAIRHTRPAGAGPVRRRGLLAGRLACIGVLLAAAPGAQAQDGARFGGRLSIVPVDFATRANVSGSGEAEAVLEDRTLTVDGTFEGLSSPATSARLHRAPPARRGPAVFALDVTAAASGRIEGEVDLDDMQVEALHRGEYYVQIATRNNPEGEIRGWLLPRGDEAAEAAAGPSATPVTPARYLASQARAGEAAYQDVCASCHRRDMGGGLDTPELAGPAFRSMWGGRPVRELLGYVEAAMPPAGRRPDEATRAAIVAYILQRNGAGAGDAALSAASAGVIGP